MPRPQWSWPSDIPSNPPSSEDATSPDNTHPTAAEQPESAPSGQAPPRERHYPSRTCRICLEVVNPSFEVNEGVSSFLAGKPKVRYVSEDPELGRLISPCKCKGTQRYVHEGCLQAWRQAAPLSDRNFWKCPTCHYEYRLERLRWGRWVGSRIVRAGLTLLVLLFTIFILGFFADPILNLWLDPLGTIADTVADVIDDIEAIKPQDEDPGDWLDHFLKGLFSLGLLGFVKAFFAMSPWHWWNVRTSLGGGRRGTGRDRIESISWAIVAVGVITFIGAVWKAISVLSARALEKASERVVDVQGDDDADEEGEETETRKDK